VKKTWGKPLPEAGKTWGKPSQKPDREHWSLMRNLNWMGRETVEGEKRFLRRKFVSRK
jgi:hypothetical protein